MVAQMDNLELQIGVLDVNVEELTRSVQSMHQDMRAFLCIKALCLHPFNHRKMSNVKMHHHKSDLFLKLLLMFLLIFSVWMLVHLSYVEFGLFV